VSDWRRIWLAALRLRQQLEMALSMIAHEGAGVLIYEQQEAAALG